MTPVGIGLKGGERPDDGLLETCPEAFIAESLAYYDTHGTRGKRKEIGVLARRMGYEYCVIKDVCQVFNKQSVMDACGRMIPEFRKPLFEIDSRELDRDKHVIIEPTEHQKGLKPSKYMVTARGDHFNYVWADHYSVSHWLWKNGSYIHHQGNPNTMNQLRKQFRKVVSQLWSRFHNRTIPHMVKQGLEKDADITLQYHPTRLCNTHDN
jgi:hypothetical protein